jgi:hypothetical protein
MSDVRTDKFFRECDGEIYPLSEGEQRGVMTDGTQCPDCRHATFKEVLACWILADDERRREIELASRPTEAGEYVIYFLEDEPGCGTLDCTFQIMNDSNMAERLEYYERGLWEKI